MDKNENESNYACIFCIMDNHSNCNKDLIIEAQDIHKRL